MREIKFRAWDWTNKVMLQPYCSIDVNGTFTFLNTSIGYKQIMQYTGLKDKNGKEIYEGDVYFNDGWTGGCKGQVVEWDANGGFTCFCDGEYGENPSEVEVIGNIYENPELLEEK